MQKFIPFLAAATLVASSAAMAQTTAPTTPAPAPSAVEITPPLVPKPGMSTTQDLSKKGSAPMLTDEQAKAWINKTVYSSDDKNLGEVAAFQRDTAGNVTEMHADIGGFLGLGETRVRVMQSDFKLATDRVVLNITSEQAKNLPKIVR